MAVKDAFRLHGEGSAAPPALLGVHTASGGFHVKAGVLRRGREYAAIKVNANFPGNRERWGLPTIQGLIVLSDAENGSPLAIMDSIEITILRTGAATAVAASCLARPGSTVVTVCGCGNQGKIQLRALLTVLPLRRAFAWDADSRQAETVAAEFSPLLKVEPISGSELHAALLKSDLCVTCTPAKAFYVRHEDIRPGTFIAAVGADSETKQELDPLLFKGNKIIADILDQCAAIGDLHHAIAGGIVSTADVYAELGEIVAGKKPGRTKDDEIIIFDSTGMALQDAAAAIVVYENALRAGFDRRLDFSSTAAAPGAGEAGKS
jgi:ornithine cyclodeaminase/alanine dehydrogenase-like protein (mu-crystallin family)